MTRIPGHTIADAPDASRPLLEGVVPFSPTGKLLNLHAQMAHSPAVLAAYTSIRQVTAAHGTLEPRVRAALMLATAGVSHSAYAVAVVREAAARAGRVSDLTWQQAAACGWSSQELAEAFAYLALTVFTAYFLNYAQTPVDLPSGAAAAGERG